MISDPIAAAHGMKVLCAADMFTSAPTNLAPALDTRLAGEWDLLGHITARDAVFRKGPMGLGFTVCYGFLARNKVDPKWHIAVVRGTASLVEWIEDAEFAPVPHPVAGRAEAGFWGVYETMQYASLGAAPTPSAVAYVGILDDLPHDARVTVIGHSLGSALATYLAFDLASQQVVEVEGCFLASPQPGDEAFARAFDARVAQYKLYNYLPDAVPHVPFGTDYTHLPRATWIWPKDAQARIKFGLQSNHHVSDYSAMLDKATWSFWRALALPIDLPMFECVLG